jgi:menaquinone-9 beta-reductase
MDAFADIVVIGAGPAGSLSAYLLAARHPRARVIVLDALATPRHKPCGEYLTPGAVGVLQRSGLLNTVINTGVRVLPRTNLSGRYGGPSIAHGPIFGYRPDHPFGLGIRREHFDAALQHAAAERVALYHQARVVRCEREGQIWHLTVHYGETIRHLRCNFLIGADGRQSTTRRQLGLNQPCQRRRFALVCRAHGIADQQAVEMHVGPFGQIGLCPLSHGEVNLNLLLAPSASAYLRRVDVRTLMQLALASTPTLAQRTADAQLGPVLTTGSLPHASRSVITDGACLVGDAAGFCDPFTGEGMTLALVGAEILANTTTKLNLLAPLSQPALQNYALGYHQHIGRRRRLGGLLQYVVDRRRLSDAVSFCLRFQPTIAHLLIADTAAYHKKNATI